MEIQRFEQDSRMSDAVAYGNTLYIGGQICVTREGIREQAEDTLAIIDRLLAIGGSDKSRVLNVMIYLADRKDLPAFNEVWDAWIVPGCAPARACVAVAMVNEKCRVELCVTAAR